MREGTDHICIWRFKKRNCFSRYVALIKHSMFLLRLSPNQTNKTIPVSVCRSRQLRSHRRTGARVGDDPRAEPGWPGRHPVRAAPVPKPLLSPRKGRAELPGTTTPNAHTKQLLRHKGLLVLGCAGQAPTPLAPLFNKPAAEGRRTPRTRLPKCTQLQHRAPEMLQLFVLNSSLPCLAQPEPKTHSMSS